MSKLARKKTLPPKAPVDSMSLGEFFSVLQVAVTVVIGIFMSIYLADISLQLKEIQDTNAYIARHTVPRLKSIDHRIYDIELHLRHIHVASEKKKGQK